MRRDIQCPGVSRKQVAVPKPQSSTEVGCGVVVTPPSSGCSDDILSQFRGRIKELPKYFPANPACGVTLHKLKKKTMPLIAQNPTDRVILGLMTFGEYSYALPFYAHHSC
jgi:hypothetical protein